MAFENISKGEFTSCKQKGIPNHCFCAQVFKPDGKSLLTIDPTDNEKVSSEYAEFISFFLNLQQRYDISKLEEAVKLLSELEAFLSFNITPSAENMKDVKNDIEQLLKEIKK